jgi:hypothetical protein
MAGVIGGGAAVAGTIITASYEDDRSRDEFFREEREALYAEFITASQLAEAAIQEYFPLHYDGAHPNETLRLPSAEALTSMEALVEDVRLASARVSLVAGGATTASAEMVVSDLEHGLHLVRGDQCTDDDDLQCVTMNPDGRVIIRDLPAGTDYNNLYSDLESFTHAARKELGVD